MTGFDAAATGMLELFPFERGRSSILAAPVRVGAGTHVVLELFDKPVFSDEDRRLVAAAADLGADLLRQALAERQTHELLFSAVEAALAASDGVAKALTAGPDALDPPPSASAAVMAQLRAGLRADPHALADADTVVELAEAIRSLAARHGPAPVKHCVRLVTDLHRLLDTLTAPE